MGVSHCTILDFIFEICEISMHQEVCKAKRFLKNIKQTPLSLNGFIIRYKGTNNFIILLRKAIFLLLTHTVCPFLMIRAQLKETGLCETRQYCRR